MYDAASWVIADSGKAILPMMIKGSVSPFLPADETTRVKVFLDPLDDFMADLYGYPVNQYDHQKRPYPGQPSEGDYKLPRIGVDPKEQQHENECRCF